MMTYSDLLQHVSRTVYGFGAGTGASASRDQIRSAIQMAYRKLPTYGPWHRYTSLKRFNIKAPVSHSVTVSSDGLTLSSTDGAWPSWAAGNTITLGNTASEVESVSGTDVTLKNPVESSYYGTTATATLYNDRHALPDDFISPSMIALVSPPREIAVVTQTHAARVYRYPRVDSIPDFAYITTTSNGTYINFIPYPTTRLDVDVAYVRKLSAITYSGMDAVDSDGTISISGTSVTGTGTQFSSGMVGAVLRVGTTTDHPTDSAGFTPYVAEAVISSVSSATALTVATSLGTYTDVYYSISSILDVDDHVFSVLLALSLTELSAMIGKQIPTDLRGAILQARAAEAHYTSATTLRGGRSGMYLVGNINYV